MWEALAAACRLLPNPPLTEGQVALMRQDNVADPRLPGLGALEIEQRLGYLDAPELIHRDNLVIV